VTADLTQYALLAVVAVVTIVIVAAFSKRLGIAAPLILVVVGVAASFLPGIPADFEVPPEVVLVGLLPPLLYSAAINVPIVDFRRNLNTITALSVLLVVATSFITGFLLFLIFPDLNFAAAVALGAVISPTDAVAATSLGKRLGLPPRLVTILEGESLVNDATALVLLRSAIAATAATVSFWGVIGNFAFAAALAIVVGFIVGAVTVFLRSKLHDPVLDIAISFAVPFLAYIPAEEWHGSGVLAVVVAGLYAGHASSKRFSPQARINERLNWRTVQFVLENGVFLLMGLQISGIILHVNEKPDHFPVLTAVLIGLMITGVVVLVRFLFVGPLLYTLRRRNEFREKRNGRFAKAIVRLRKLSGQDDRGQRRADRAQKELDRRTVDLETLRREGLGWRGGVVLSWSGMRGVVTLAAAQSLPTDIPYRAQLILIAFTVAITSLLVQGGSLPLLIRALKVGGVDGAADRQEYATLLEEIAETALGVLENPSLSVPGGALDPEVIERVRRDTLANIEAAYERVEHGASDEGLANPHQQYRALRREVIQAERDALIDAESAGNYPSRIIERAQAMLDLEETRLGVIDDPDVTRS
jgi:NhaP-type Na+/H+ or K+/H+ antiporter